MGPRVSGPTCHPHTEADAWDPHVSWAKRKKKKKVAWFTGLKAEKAGSGWPKKLGSASRTGLIHGSSGRLGSLDRATAHWLPLTLSLSYRLGGETRARGPAFQARGGVDKVGK